LESQAAEFEELGVLPQLCRVMVVTTSRGVKEAAIAACGGVLLQYPRLRVPPLTDEGVVEDLVARMQV
jgi:hypothetical protein